MAKKKGKFRRRLPLVGIFVLLIAGICFFMYPILSSWIADNSAQAVIRQYDEQVQKIGDEAINRLAAQADEYNKALAKKQTNKVSVFSYNEMLSVTDALGYIEIPKIGVYTPIYHGLGNVELQKGIGHMEGTSLPVGGESTHSVLAGHTGLPGSKLFTDIDTLTEGDVFYIHVLDRVLKYRVDRIRTVLPNNSDNIEIIDGEDHVTLVTCTPYGINDHRLLVRGTRVSYKLPAQEAVSDPTVSPGTETQVSTIKNEKDVSGVQEAGDHSYSIEDENKIVLPVRTIIWYIATGVIAVVIVGILLILLLPSKHKKHKAKDKAQVRTDENDNAGDKPTDLED